MSDTTENTDEPTKAELHERVEQLESTVAKMMPSRRDALKFGAAGLVGAAGVAGASGSAEASTGSAGQIGDSSNRPDLLADQVDANEFTGSAGFIKTKTRVFLGADSAADPVPFDAVSYDPDNNFDTAGNQYIAPASGTYQIALNVRLEDGVSAGTRSRFRIRQNNVGIAAVEIEATGDFPTGSVTDVRELTSGDSVEVRNLGGVTLNSSERDTYISVIRLE